VRRARAAAPLLLAACLAVALPARRSKAADLAPGAAGQATIDVFARAALLEDPGGALSIDDLVRGSVGSRFRVSEGARSNIGITGSAFWLRFDLTVAPGLWFLRLYQGVDHAQLYLDAGSGPRLLHRTGKAYPFGTRVVPSKEIYLPLPRASAGRVFLRLESRDTLRLNATLMPAEAVLAAVSAENLWAGTYLGAMAALWLFNLVIFLWLRDRAYGYYLIFQASLALLQAAFDQVTFRFLWPDWPRWAAWSESFFIGWAYFGAAGFSRSFLAGRGAQALPRSADRAMHAFQWLSLILVVGAPLTALPIGSCIALFQALASALLLWTFAIIAWRRGVENARFFLAGWSTLIAMAVWQSLTALGLLPSFAFSDHAVRLGSIIEGVLFSLALADRMNRLRRENSRIQADMIRQRLDGLTHLAGGIIHEIGNPLNFMRGGVQDLRRRTVALSAAAGNPVAAPLLEAADLVSRGAERIERIINNLRGQIGEAPLPVEVVSLERVVTDTLALVRGRLAAGGVEVVVRIPELPPVCGRSVELGQVLMNLLVNAAEAMPTGGTVTVTGATAGEQVSLIVADTGPGIPEEIRAAIFDPFFTTRPRGTGLGLFISQQIVLRHTGQLALTGGGTGASFRLTLNRCR
jgi:signal transduction histidine kinase